MKEEFPTQDTSGIGMVNSDSARTNLTRKNICIIDGIADAQSIKKGASMRTCLDVANSFLQAVERMLQGYTGGRVILDRYLGNSWESQIRAKRSVNIESVKFNKSDKTNIKMVALKTFL